MPKGIDAYTSGMPEAEKVVENSKKAIDRLDGSIISLGDTLDYVANKMKLINQTTTATSKGIEKTTKTLEYYDKILKSTFKIQTKSNISGEDVVSKITETPDEPTPRIRGLVGYKGIKESAELTSSETKKLADGSKQLIETFKKVDETGTTTYKAINKKIVDIKRSLKDVNDEQDKTTKKTSKFGILLNQIKRIAVYRAIRRGLQIITQIAVGGIQNIRSVDKELDTSLKNISNSFTAIKNSFATVLGELLKSISPIIVRIADGIANITNRISEAKAAMSGATTYTKILTSDTEEWQEQLKKVQGSLLSFDKFESLSSGDTFTGVKEEEEVGMDTEKAVSILATLESVKAVLAGIAGIIVTMKIGELISKISKINSILGGTKGTLSILGGIAGVIGGLYLTIKGIVNIVNWDDQTTGLEKFLDVLTLVLGVVAAIAGVLALTKAKTITGAIAGGIAIAAAIGGIVLSSKSNAIKSARASGYIDGGVPDKSELFYMNEYGKPEAMMNLGGQTNVINQDQLRFSMKEGFKEAFVELGLLEMLSDQRIVLEGRDIDNSAVARGLFNALKTESKRRGGNQL